MRYLSNLLLLIATVCSGNAGFSQHGTKDWEWEWAPVGAVWLYETANMGTNNIYAQYWYVRSAKDTLFHGFNCRKLEVERHYWLGFEPVKMPDRFTYQDGGDIYFYNADINEFVLSFSYDIQHGDTVTWQMPVFEHCVNSYYLDTILNWDVGYLSGAGTAYTPYSVFMYSNVPISSYRIRRVENNCFAGELSTNTNYSHGRYLDFIGTGSDLYELTILEEMQTSCQCYYDGSVIINLAIVSINNDTIIYAEDSCLNYYNKFNGISSHIGKKSLRVYPNPFTDLINVDLPAIEGNYDISVYNLMGQLLYSDKTRSNNTPLHLSRLVNGTYLLQIRTNDNVFNQRIIKN
ncbi:MAG: T9SS type A sorting domain-containing protein [Bacteroidales bacterium]|nr:T9SS type A sorting domain-containing protein [Bacteroidales bacterium]HOY38826.1 T9SS type A sorting domain-containing protein [Bacteroidales bacterium]